jgi:triphosphatase
MIKGAVTRPTTTGELALQVMRQQATLFAEEVPQAQLGADPEHVHDARVATRRLRAALRLFEDILPESSEGLDVELRWIAGYLGPVRDLDVQMKRLSAIAAELGLSDAVSPYAAWLDQQRERAQVSFDAAFQSDRFVGLTERLRQLNDLAPDELGDVPLEDDAPRRLRQTYGKFRTRADGLCPSSPAELFHRARIGAKRLRYAAEFFEPLYGKPARRVIVAATAVQDLLGDHQDGIVNTQRIEEAVRAAGAEWPPESTLALGQLIQWEANHGVKLRHQFNSAYRDVRSAWRRLRSKI